MAAKYWLKLYHESLHDFKMHSLTDRLYRRVIECFLMAGEKDEEGFLPPLEEMAFILRTSADELLDELIQLEATGILTSTGEDWLVTNFAERQSAVSNAERSRRWRERQQRDQFDPEESEDKDTSGDLIMAEGVNQDLFDECRIIYETKKGALISDGSTFAKMINKFEKNGVTVGDYAAAIDAMDKSGKYTGKSPTSYESWAINIAKDRRNPPKTGKTKRSIDDVFEKAKAIARELDKQNEIGL